MRIKKIKLLKFEELNEKEKEGVLNNYRYINTEDLDLHDFEIPIIEKDIKPYFDYDTFNYSLNYCQGDGCRIRINGNLH